MTDPEDREPDKEEKIIRFGCGAVLGAVVGLYLAFRFIALPFGTVAVIVAGAVVLCGYLALRYGDAFWHRFLQNWWWWW